MATGGAESVEAIEIEASDLECPVCSEYFTDPKLLPCAHLVCRACLVSLLQQENGATCPLCRCIIAPPQPRSRKNRRFTSETPQEPQTPEDQFPTDESMAALVEATITLSSQHICCVCVDVAAVSLCLQCGDMFCGHCTRLHQRQSLSKHHDVQDLGSLTAEKLALKRRIICNTHRDKMCELFCPTHGQSICYLCAASKHQGCSGVKDLEEQTEEAREVLTQLVASLAAGEQKVQQAIKEVEQDLKEVERCAQDAKREMEAACDQLEKSVKACRSRLSMQLLKATSSITSDLTRKRSSLVNQQVKLTSHKNAAQRMQDRPVQRIDMAAVLNSRVSDLQSSDSTQGKVKLLAKISLAIDKNVLSHLEKEILELGQVTTTEEEAPELHFNKNHGPNIQLSDNLQTAERHSGLNNAIVLSAEPLKVSILYEVQIEEIMRKPTKKNFHIGVVTEIPEILPPTAQQFSSAVLVSPHEVLCDGWKVNTSVGAALGRVTKGSHVGLLLDKHRNLHLYLDGKHQGQITTDVADPCYAMFDLGYNLQKVTALRVTRVNRTSGHERH